MFGDSCQGRPISARGAPCNGQGLAQQQLGLFNAHLVNKLLTNKESVVGIQQVSMFAKGYCIFGVDGVAKSGNHCKRD